ncbi:MAG: type II toxin-antitoxin system prevent-host-death family antitoxin [Spirochaetaceae bacterium]|nr:MAG: type II toxin-antitoxin system prevent-host-death family antitoxin [Spirochaetaceae bacterium]
MTDIIVSVAEFKAKLSKYLAAGRSANRRIVIMKRKEPIAAVIPYNENGTKSTPMEGLASLAGTWNDLEDIVPDIDTVVAARKAEGYREVPL